MPCQDLCRPRDDLLQATLEPRKIRGLVRPVQDDGLGAMEPEYGLAQTPPGQEPTPAEGIGGVHQDEIQISVKLPVLKAVVKQ
jgi:hypothetical protein